MAVDHIKENWDDLSDVWEMKDMSQAQSYGDIT